RDRDARCARRHASRPSRCVLADAISAHAFRLRDAPSVGRLRRACGPDESARKLTTSPGDRPAANARRCMTIASASRSRQGDPIALIRLVLNVPLCFSRRALSGARKRDMDWLGTLLNSQPFVAVFLAIGLGYAMPFPGVGTIVKIVAGQALAAAYGIAVH